MDYHVYVCDVCGREMKGDDINKLINFKMTSPVVREKDLCPNCWGKLHTAIHTILDTAYTYTPGGGYVGEALRRGPRA